MFVGQIPPLRSPVVDFGRDDSGVWIEIGTAKENLSRRLGKNKAFLADAPPPREPLLKTPDRVEGRLAGAGGATTLDSCLRRNDKL
jgi:hypothetical protein